MTDHEAPAARPAVRRRGRSPDSRMPPGNHQPPLVSPDSPRLVRLLVATASGALLTDLAWRAVPQKLSISTNVIGNPIFANFNYRRYQLAFYLVALL